MDQFDQIVRDMIMSGRIFEHPQDVQYVLVSMGEGEVEGVEKEDEEEADQRPTWNDHPRVELELPGITIHLPCAKRRRIKGKQRVPDMRIRIFNFGCGRDDRLEPVSVWIYVDGSETIRKAKDMIDYDVEDFPSDHDMYIDEEQEHLYEDHVTLAFHNIQPDTMMYSCRFSDTDPEEQPEVQQPSFLPFAGGPQTRGDEPSTGTPFRLGGGEDRLVPTIANCLSTC